MKLPQIPYAAATAKQAQTEFHGLDLRPGAGNGAVTDDRNLCALYSPGLGSRPPRQLVQTLTKPNGMFCGDELHLVDGTSWTADGATLATVADSAKTFAALGPYVLLFPDKLCYNRKTGTVTPLESEVVSTSLEFCDGTYAGEAAEANTIEHPDGSFDWAAYFRVGDAVTISGTRTENDKTIIVREIAGNELRFYEFSFPVTGEFTGRLSVARTVPDLDFFCENENRLWGCKEDTIWCCKLGDPFNWNVFDGVATDSFSVDVGSPGDFTGAASILGYPCFFKEDHVYKVYGSRPSNYEVLGGPDLGIEAGSHKSTAIAAETMYYMARTGIVAYTGGVPRDVGAVFGRHRFHNAVAGSDGVRYYVSMQEEDGGWGLFTYDTRSGDWHREDELHVTDFGWMSGLYMLDAAGKLWYTGDREPGTAETAVDSMVTFGEWDYLSFDSKYPVRLWLRLDADEGVTVRVYLRYDGGNWTQAAQITGGGTRKDAYLPLPVRRCRSYSVKITADGPWKLWAVEHELYRGRDSRRSGG